MNTSSSYPVGGLTKGQSGNVFYCKSIALTVIGIFRIIMLCEIVGVLSSVVYVRLKVSAKF